MEKERESKAHKLRCQYQCECYVAVKIFSRVPKYTSPHRELEKLLLALPPLLLPPPSLYWQRRELSATSKIRTQKRLLQSAAIVSRCASACVFVCPTECVYVCKKFSLVSGGQRALIGNNGTFCGRERRRTRNSECEFL